MFQIQTQMVPAKIEKFLFYFSILLISGLITSCGGSSNNLSRDTAVTLILKSDEISHLKLKTPFHKNGREKGTRQEYWTSKNELTKKSGKFFTSVDYKTLGLKKPVDVIVDVTGITDATLGEGIKEAQFSWKYSDVPSVVKRFIIGNGVGVAYFRKYDDGWRLEGVNLNYSSDPMYLTGNEAEEEKEEILSVDQARREKEEKERKEKERKSRLLADSKKVKRNVFSYVFNPSKDVKVTYNITDVNIYWTDYDGRGYGSITRNTNIWYGDIGKIYQCSPKTGKNKYNKISNFAVCLDVKVNWNRSLITYVINATDNRTVNQALSSLSQATKEWHRNYSEVATVRYFEN